VAVDVSQQELAKNKGLDNDDSNGRCLGWRCLAWVRCQNHKDMIHTMIGGNRNGNDSGWTALSKVSLLSGAANFLGGLPVLKHSVVKIAEFLHSQHSDKLTGLQLPRPDQALTFSQVDEICAKLEFLDAHSGIIALHNGVSIGHNKHAGFQRVYVAPFPGRRFHDFNRMDFVFFRPPGADAETFHPDPSNVWYGQCVLAFSFILRASDGSRYKFKCVLISTLEDYVCRDDPIPGQSQCIMCLCFKVGLTKFYALLQVIGCSNLSLADFMRWMRKCQGFM